MKVFKYSAMDEKKSTSYIIINWKVENGVAGSKSYYYPMHQNWNVESRVADDFKDFE